jgi:hypothetical protein
VTFAKLAGADPTDAPAAAAGLPPVDGVDLRGLLMPGGNRTSPRTRIIIGDTKNGDMAAGDTYVGGIITSDGWKLLRGHLGNPFWQGPLFPNRSAYPAGSLVCSPACLFNVRDDPHELEDVAKGHPDIVAALMKEVEALQAGVWNPNRGNVTDGLACKVGLGANRGFWGPFLE